MGRFMRRSPFATFVPALVLAMFAVGCGEDELAEVTTSPATSAAVTTLPGAQDETENTEDIAAPTTTEFNIAMIMRGTKEEGWNATMIDSITRLTEDNPYGLTIVLDEIEEIDLADGERVIRDLAQTGEYEVILAHSIYSDAVAMVKDEYPDRLFAYSGSGNEPLGGNGYWIDVFIHEPAYLAGIIAGMMTQTDQISAVAAFPFPNVNGPLHAFFDGARSVNPDVTVEVTYIESWFDPGTAQEAAAAQIASGSDMIYAERFGPFAVAEEAGDVWAFGHFTDQLGLSDVVLTSAVARWDRAFLDLIDAWYAHETEGVPYAAPMERIVYSSMRDGGSSLGELSADLPADVVAAVQSAQTAILSGELEVPLIVDPIE